METRGRNKRFGGHVAKATSHHSVAERKRTQRRPRAEAKQPLALVQHGERGPPFLRLAAVSSRPREKLSTRRKNTRKQKKSKSQKKSTPTPVRPPAEAAARTPSLSPSTCLRLPSTFMTRCSAAWSILRDLLFAASAKIVSPKVPPTLALALQRPRPLWAKQQQQSPQASQASHGKADQGRAGRKQKARKNTGSATQSYATRGWSRRAERCGAVQVTATIKASMAEGIPRCWSAVHSIPVLV